MSAIAVLSTYTDDILLDPQGTILRTQDGGPAYFITNALSDLHVEFTCENNSRLTAEILMTPEGEFGKIPIKPVPHALPQRMEDWTIVSSLLDEWDVVAARDRLPRHLCLDLQGYLRDGEHFGRKRGWDDIAQIADKVFCLKGTVEEVELVPSAIIAAQKQRLLVITNGAAGVDIYCKGRHTHVAVNAVSGITDTIGAGDTFFGYFVGRMSQGDTPTVAARAATAKTTHFLEHKSTLLSNHVA